MPISASDLLNWFSSLPQAIRWTYTAFTFREFRDSMKLRRSLPEARAMLRCFGETDLGRLQNELSVIDVITARLNCAQRMMEHYVGSCLCSLKLIHPGDTSFSCIYPSPMYIPADLISMKDEIGDIPRNRSCAGYALENNETLIVSDLRNLNRYVDKEETVDLLPQTRRILKQYEIRGLAVVPISVARSKTEPSVPSGVFKVDFQKKNGLVNNKPTKALLNVLSELFTYALQFEFHLAKMQSSSNARIADRTNGFEVIEGSQPDADERETT